MARIPATRTAAAPVRTGALRHAKTNEQRKSSYKVIIEEITEKKKKLHTTLSFRTQAPSGYTFVAAGEPRLTSKCKELARSQGLTVYIVSTSRLGSLKEQVGRLGYHFPSHVVEQACQSLGVTKGQAGTVRPEQRRNRYPLRSAQHRAQPALTKNPHTKSRAGSIGSNMDQSEIDSRAAVAIRELFPKIPERDVQFIVAQAFQKGAKKVGTAFDQPFIRRVHLAVGAYIRHTYTKYDMLLKSHGYLEARRLVEPSTLDKVLEWRDEKDDPDAVEDILREVIVISDDEDEGIEDDSLNDHDSNLGVADNRESSHEVDVQPVDYSILDERSRYERPVSPEDEWAPSVKFIRQLPSPSAEIVRQQQDRIARHHAHRYQRWQDAIDRSRQKAYPVAGYELKPIHDNIRLTPRSTVNHAVSQRPDPILQRSSLAQHAHLEPDTPIPSVERDLNDSERHIQYTSRSDLAGSQRQFQDRVAESDFVELGDDPASPVHNRRRMISNNAITQYGAMYPTMSGQRPLAENPFQYPIYRAHPVPEHNSDRMPRLEGQRYVQSTDRHIQLVPFNRYARRVSVEDPMRSDVQHHARAPAHERHVWDTFPGASSEIRQHVVSSYAKSYPEDVNAHHVSYGLMPRPNPMSESSRTVHPIRASSRSGIGDEARFISGSRRFIRPDEGGLHETISRHKPPYLADDGIRSYAYDQPAAERTYGAQVVERQAITEAPLVTSYTPWQDHENEETVALHPQISKYDCPMALQGSFCNRLKGNGFLRKEHLDEHMRNVHRMVPQTERSEQVRMSHSQEIPPRGQLSSRRTCLYPEEAHTDQPQNRQSHGDIHTGREQEVVHISSSPIVEERHAGNRREDYEIRFERGPHVRNDVHARHAGHGRQIPRPIFSNNQEQYNESRLPRKVILLD